MHIQINIKAPERVTKSTDHRGRRYGDYWWLSFGVNTYKIHVFPLHMFGCNWTKAWNAVHPKG